ncbi:MAG: hypothetical protein HYZ14_18110 [Bacteroidetes bacterium]|nr:hypothetical protein [Bacteroidota bacterium]
MSRKIFAVSAGLAFLMSLISMYFGSSIYNANENVHIQYLNEMDHIRYYDADMVPGLTRLAAILSIPFLLGILGIELYVFRKTPVPAAKKIALAISILALILIILAMVTIKTPLQFDFSKWGFAWVFGGLFTIAGNALSVFLKGN